jgi:hypothetical protein
MWLGLATKMVSDVEPVSEEHSGCFELGISAAVVLKFHLHALVKDGRFEPASCLFHCHNIEKQKDRSIGM